MLNTNGSIANRGSRPDNNCIIMDTSRISGVVESQTHRYNNNGTRINVNNNSRIISQHQYPLNASALHNATLDNSKHSVYSTTSGLAGPAGPLHQQPPASSKLLNGGLNISNRVRNQSTVNKFIAKSKQVGVKEMLVSLGLLCLVSLLLALLSLIFLLKISPVTANDIRELLRAEQLTVITAEEYVVVYEVTLALCALTLSLNLCCLLVCAIQFLFAVKLVKSPHGGNDRYVFFLFSLRYFFRIFILLLCARIDVTQHLREVRGVSSVRFSRERLPGREKCKRGKSFVGTFRIR